MPARLLQTFAVLVVVLTAATARAQAPAGGDIARVGERAYAVGEYAFAIQAFKEAYRRTKKASLLFSIARAYRQRYALERRARDAAEAVRFYRRYLSAAPRGEHAEEAREAIAELGPRPTAVSRERRVTRVGLTSDAIGASARIDNGRPRKLPLFVEVKPGKHRLVIRAPGFTPRVHVVRMGEGSIYARHVALKPMPGKLDIEGTSEAAVHVDGKRAGMLPLEEAIAVEPGRRFVAVTRNGYHPRARYVDVERGKVTKVEMDLEMTDQRKAAWPLVAVGAAGVAAGIVLGVFAVVRHREAIDIQDRGGPAAEYEPVIEARDDFRLGSGIAAGTGFGLFLLGGGLLVFDTAPLPSRVTGGALRLGF